MSFFFKSSKKQQNAGPTPATRGLKSSEGLPTNIPVLHTSTSREALTKSPQPPSLANGLYTSNSLSDKNGIRSNDVAKTSLDRPNGRSTPSFDEPATQRDNLPADLDRANHQQPPAGNGAAPTSTFTSPPQERLNFAPPQRSAPTVTAPNTSSTPEPPSPYPWSQRQLSYDSPHTVSPFPRYGSAVNASSGKDGNIYIMGGLINGSTVKGDLWTIAASTPSLGCHAVQTFAEGPGPRVGHASLLVGNAFIVFGGDTKTTEQDLLDDTLYLLNTSTKQWSRAAPAGPRPPGRYGHTLNILGSKIYIFGGQVEGFFFNDLVAFDLNALQQPDNRWNILIKNTIEGGPPHGQIPPARTNHTVITWNEKLYLFGGTDGVTWFNDVWAYDPRAVSNPWSLQECIGYIPTPREGHAAALVGDVMYVFGGRTEEGNDLGDLAAFKISSRRWFTFQNMGPSPSPRSGHSMTAVGKYVYVVAGEPSSAPRDAAELSLVYCLDTSKIRYPTDAQQPAVNESRTLGQKRLADKGTTGPPRSTSPRLPGEQTPSPRIQQSQPAAQPAQINGQAPRALNQQSPPQTSTVETKHQPHIQSQSSTSGRGTPDMSRQQHMQPQMSSIPLAQRTTQRSNSAQSNERQPRQNTRQERSMSPPAQAADRNMAARSLPPIATDVSTKVKPVVTGPSSKTSLPAQQDTTAARARLTQSDQVSGTPPLVAAPNRPVTKPREQDADLADRSAPYRSLSESKRSRSDSQNRETARATSITSQSTPDALERDLDKERSKTTWYATELALAKKAGYVTQTAAPPQLDERNTDAVNTHDKALFEALLQMRTEMVNMQASITAQARTTADRIAEIEAQRDSAINEAVFAKARLAGHASGSSDGGPDLNDNRTLELEHKLANALSAHTTLARSLDALKREKEAEAQARQMAEDSSEIAQQRLTELDADRQQKSSDLESIRDELYRAQKNAREATTTAADASSAHKMLLVEHKDVLGRLEDATAATESHSSVLAALHEAVSASQEKAETYEKQLIEERATRHDLQSKFTRLRSEHEERTAELDSTAKELRDTRELAEKNAGEARTHRQAMLDGLGKLKQATRSPNSVNDEKLEALRQDLEASQTRLRETQTETGNAADKLRSAEERIAGLEAYQEQASREGLGLRKQIQAALRDARTLGEEKTRLEQQVQSQQLEMNAVNVQHSALKDILNERGMNAADLRRNRMNESPNSQQRQNAGTPDASRMRELEQQLESSTRSQDELKNHLEELQQREDVTRREYEEKLTALDSDQQAVAKYLRGTEKMLSKMKQELQRVKQEAATYLTELETLRKNPNTGNRDIQPEAAEGWEEERTKLQQNLDAAESALKSTIAPLEAKITALQSDLGSRDRDLQELRNSHEGTQTDLRSLQTTHDASRADIERLTRENQQLETRAKGAEDKVHLLLDQVGGSADRYGKQANRPNGTSNPSRHVRNESEAESTYSQTAARSDISEDETHPLHGTAAMRAASALSPASTHSDHDGRNSLALDNLASELDALRSHWESTNQNNYRLSDKYESDASPRGRIESIASSATDQTPTTASRTQDDEQASTATGSNAATPSGLSDWTRTLERQQAAGPHGVGSPRSRSRTPSPSKLSSRSPLDSDTMSPSPSKLSSRSPLDTLSPSVPDSATSRTSAASGSSGVESVANAIHVGAANGHAGGHEHARNESSA